MCYSSILNSFFFQINKYTNVLHLKCLLYEYNILGIPFATRDDVLHLCQNGWWKEVTQWLVTYARAARWLSNVQVSARGKGQEGETVWCCGARGGGGHQQQRPRPRLCWSVLATRPSNREYLAREHVIRFLLPVVGTPPSESEFQV